MPFLWWPNNSLDCIRVHTCKLVHRYHFSTSLCPYPLSLNTYASLALLFNYVHLSQCVYLVLINVPMHALANIYTDTTSLPHSNNYGLDKKQEQQNNGNKQRFYLTLYLPPQLVCASGYSYLYICVDTYIHRYVYAYVYVCVYIYIYICIHIYIYIERERGSDTIYIYIYIYIHTYTPAPRRYAYAWARARRLPIYIILYYIISYHYCIIL